MSAWNHVPNDFRRQGIRTPEEAADYISDIIGICSVWAIDHRADLAAMEGRQQDRDFCEATLAILIDWYSKPPDADYPPEIRALMDEMEDEPPAEEPPPDEPQEPDPSAIVYWLSSLRSDSWSLLGYRSKIVKMAADFFTEYSGVNAATLR
jgi:hypothetical protein